jgi:putative endonuclease
MANPTTLTKQELGKAGERLVHHYVEKKLGWTIIDKNWRCPHGEIDLIAHDGDTLVIIEVRTRQGKNATNNAFLSINQNKQWRLTQLTEYYCAQQAVDDDTPLRVDVFALARRTDGTFKINHLRDALTW